MTVLSVLALFGIAALFLSGLLFIGYAWWLIAEMGRTLDDITGRE